MTQTEISSAPDNPEKKTHQTSGSSDQTKRRRWKKISRKTDIKKTDWIQSNVGTKKESAGGQPQSIQTFTSEE